MTTCPVRCIAGFLLVLGCAGCSRPEPGTLFAAAEALQLKNEKEASAVAIAKYRDALAAWKRKGDLAKAARAGQRLGRVYERVGSLHHSLEAYQDALSLARQTDDTRFVSELHSDVGMALCLAADRENAFEQAERHCESALTISRQVESKRDEAKALNCFGEVAYFRGNVERALEFHHLAAPIWERLGDRRGQAETRLSEGWAYTVLSQLENAQAAFESALVHWKSVGDSRGQAITLVADARLRQRRSEYQEALNSFDAALILLEPMGDPVWEGASLTGKGTVYLYMADTASAIRLWERALALFEKAGLKDASADALLSLGANDGSQ